MTCEQADNILAVAIVLVAIGSFSLGWMIAAQRYAQSLDVLLKRIGRR